MLVCTSVHWHRVVCAIMTVATVVDVPACAAQQIGSPVTDPNAQAGRAITSSSVDLLYVNEEGDVAARELGSGRTHLVARLGPALRASLPVASPSGRWLCVRSRFEQLYGPDYPTMLVMLERYGDGWRVRWTTDVGDWRGVPVFAAGERYLVVGRVQREHLGWLGTEVEVRAAEHRPDKLRAEAFVFDVASGNRITAPIAPLHARCFDIIGSPVDEHRVLLTRWKADGKADIVEYNVDDNWGSRLVGFGLSPLVVDRDRFVFVEDENLLVAPLRKRDGRVRLFERGAPRAVVPGGSDVLVEVWERDPAYANKDLPTLWRIDANNGKRERVLDYETYSNEGKGWVSFLRDSPAGP